MVKRGGCQGITRQGTLCSCRALKGGCYCGIHEKIYGGIDFAYPVKKAFQVASNAYRKANSKGRSRPLEYGELHYGLHNYTGPGTRVDLYPNYPPYNDIDNCSRTHDLEYAAADQEKDPKKRERLIRLADIKAVECYNKYPNENGYLAASLGINGKMALEKTLPIVAKSIAPTYFGSRYPKKKLVI